ncbi:unnamed protein product [Timema podura]|uniref:Uncharacterized protein n=1 Tax=Timema podura TaxID=61482 RepID=A0ABN7PSV7_TIMPD|nr:unnamed protein product [Timema podura]
MQEKFIEESETRVDVNQMAVFPGAVCGRCVKNDSRTPASCPHASPPGIPTWGIDGRESVLVTGRDRGIKQCLAWDRGTEQCLAWDRGTEQCLA